MISDDMQAVPDDTPPQGHSAVTSDFSSASSSEHQLITYYHDVTEEVDLHFNRALSLSSTSSSCNDLHRITLTNNGTISPFSPDHLSPAPMPTPSTSLTSTASSHSLPGSLTANDGDIHSLPPLTVKVPPLTETNSAEKHRDKPATVKIVHPELSKKLLHPEIDSYADAPRVPGQPTSTSATPLELPYIKGISITESDIQRVANLKLKRESQPMGGAQYINARGCYTTQYATGPFPSTRQYNSELVYPEPLHSMPRPHPHTSPPDTRFGLTYSAPPDSTPSSYPQILSYQPVAPPTNQYITQVYHHTLPLSHDPARTGDNEHTPAELSFDDVNRILAL